MSETAEPDTRKLGALDLAILPVPLCPDCASPLTPVVRPAGNTMTVGAYAATYGDWRCPSCKPTGKTWHHYRVFWNVDVIAANRLRLAAVVQGDWSPYTKTYQIVPWAAPPGCPNEPITVSDVDFSLLRHDIHVLLHAESKV